MHQVNSTDRFVLLPGSETWLRVDSNFRRVENLEADGTRTIWFEDARPASGFRFVPDGQGGFKEEPIPSFDQQDRT